MADDSPDWPRIQELLASAWNMEVSARKTLLNTYILTYFLNHPLSGEFEEAQRRLEIARDSLAQLNQLSVEKFKELLSPIEELSHTMQKVKSSIAFLNGIVAQIAATPDLPTLTESVDESTVVSVLRSLGCPEEQIAILVDLDPASAIAIWEAMAP